MEDQVRSQVQGGSGLRIRVETPCSLFSKESSSLWLQWGVTGPGYCAMGWREWVCGQSELGSSQGALFWKHHSVFTDPPMDMFMFHLGCYEEGQFEHLGSGFCVNRCFSSLGCHSKNESLANVATL